jgi:TetR/AcrR family transcriptional regulator
MSALPVSPTPRLPTDARKAEIVAAALALAGERSPALITTTEISTALGLSQGALFKHYASKEAIWLGVMDWVAENLMQLLAEAATSASSPVQALQSMFDTHIGFVLAHPGVPRIVFHELQQPADSPQKQKVQGLMQGYRQLLVELLTRAQAEKMVAADIDTAAAATQFVGMVQGLVMQSMLGGTLKAIRAQGQGVFQLYLRGIRT